jgi:hypothetical protein
MFEENMAASNRDNGYWQEANEHESRKEHGKK